MAKQLPRIHSLSTVGIQHHFHTDYIFHPFRTEFSGDSGVGKSMIADMLQLIFVGSEFQSATEGTDLRLAKTMPIGRYGYVFINVEVEPRQYIVLGMFISTATINPDPFIIQGGYGKDAYVPIQNPISFRDILNGELVEDIDAVSERLDGQFNCRKVPQKVYHEYMMEHGLLPIQITDKARLKNYARILRSFARGKDFKHDTESLKYFFFDDHKETEIYNDFQNRLDNIEADLDGHKRHKATLANVSEKEQDLIKLKSLKQEKTEAEIEFYKAKTIFHFRNIQQKEREISNNKERIKESIIRIANYKTNKLKEAIENIDALFEDIRVHSKTIQDAEIRLKEIFDAEGVLEQKKDNILQECIKLNLCNKAQKLDIIEHVTQLYGEVKTMECWIEKYRTIEKVKTTFYSQQENNRKRGQIKELEHLLNSRKLTDIFFSSNWIAENNDIEGAFHQRIEAIDVEIEKQKALSKFADTSNPHSLSSWALKNGKALSLEQESVLVHFKELMTKKPELFEEGVKYLPSPEELFDSLSTEDNDVDGFWLKLNGIHEYIPFNKPQFFNTNDIAKLTTYFAENYNKSKSELTKLDKQRKELINLKAAINQVGNEVLNVYKEKTKIENYQNDDSLEKSQNEFERCCTHYFYAEDIKRWKTELDKCIGIIKQADQTKEYVTQQLKTIAGFISKNKFQSEPNPESLRNVLQNLEKEKGEEKEDNLHHLQWYSRLFQPLSDSITEESKEYSKRETAKQNIQRIKKELSNDNLEYDKFVLKYENLSNEKFKIDLSAYNNQYLNPSDEELIWQKKIELFRIHYDDIVKKHVHISSQNRFKDSDDFIILSKEILPEILTRKIINNEIEVLQQIKEYLIEITEKYTEFSDVKLNILKEIFSQVQDCSIEYMTEIADISNYFARNDCQISQGVSIEIKHSYSDTFPIEWIRNFEGRLEEKAMYTDLFSSLSNKIGIEEMMKEAYLQCGGKAHKIEIKHLLNPKSYFNINFSMRKSDGTINSGSTGQTYAAIALLCIARLSLIEKRAGSGKQEKGLRFMPIDETENIGSNFDMLEKIAQDYDYQLIVISRHQLDDYSGKGRYQYMLNGQSDGGRIGTFAIFNEGEDAVEYTSPISKSIQHE